MDFVPPIAIGLKSQKIPIIGFGQNGGENYFWCRFHFRFVFCALDFVENAHNIDRVYRTLFEIFGAKFQKLKKN